MTGAAQAKCEPHTNGVGSRTESGNPGHLGPSLAGPDPDVNETGSRTEDGYARPNLPLSAITAIATARGATGYGSTAPETLSLLIWVSGGYMEVCVIERRQEGQEMATATASKAESQSPASSCTQPAESGMAAAATVEASAESAPPIKTPTTPPATFRATGRPVATATPKEANATTIARSPSKNSGVSRGLWFNPPDTPITTAFNPHATAAAIAARTASREAFIPGG